MAAGSGYTAVADASITRTLVGVVSGAYTTPSTNGMYCALYTTQFTAATKAGATEWTTGSDTAYARQQMGTSPAFGWTIGAYVSGTGVQWNNTGAVTQPAVAGANQTLFSVGWVDIVTLGSGNINFFVDLTTSLSVLIGIQVVLAASNGAIFTTY